MICFFRTQNMWMWETERCKIISSYWRSPKRKHKAIETVCFHRRKFSFQESVFISCLRMSAPLTLPFSDSTLTVSLAFPLCHGPRFPGNILCFYSLLSHDLQPCMLLFLWEFPRLPTLKLNLQSGTCWQASLASSCVKYMQPSSGYIKLGKSKVERTAWLRNFGSLSSSSPSVGWPVLGSLSSTHCHEPPTWYSSDWQDSSSYSLLSDMHYRSFTTRKLPPFAYF